MIQDGEQIAPVSNELNAVKRVLIRHFNCWSFRFQIHANVCNMCTQKCSKR